MKRKDQYEASEDEKELFLREVSDARKIKREPGAFFHAKERKPLLPDEEREWREFAKGLLSGPLGEFEVMLGTEYVEGRRKGVGTVTMTRLRGGQMAVEASIDLHGMNRKEAREKVREFIRESRRERRRCLLIVHGRGKRSKEGVPVLKMNLVSWLDARSGIGKHILAFATARPCDGGPGAVYVLLES